MKYYGWKRVWRLTAILLLFFPSFFILIEIPTETKIYRNWARNMLWKTLRETPDLHRLGIWYIREPYRDLSEPDLIEVLESKYPAIDYSSIRRKFTKELADLNKNKILVVAEAVCVYLSVVASLYGGGWLIGRLFRKNSNRQAKDRM